jgi:hypothetical protein
MKYKASNYLLTNTGTKRDVWISEHPFDIPNIDFDPKIPKSNKVES